MPGESESACARSGERRESAGGAPGRAGALPLLSPSPSRLSSLCLLALPARPRPGPGSGQAGPGGAWARVGPGAWEEEAKEGRERGGVDRPARKKRGGRAGRASLAPTDRPTPPRSRALPATPGEGWAYVGGRRARRRASRPLPPPSLPPPKQNAPGPWGGCHGVLPPRVCVRRREPAAPALRSERVRQADRWTSACGACVGLCVWEGRGPPAGAHFRRTYFLARRVPVFFFPALRGEGAGALAPTVPSFHAPGRRPGGPGQITKHAQACYPSLSHPLLSLRARAGIRQDKKERARASARSTRDLCAQKRKKNDGRTAASFRRRPARPHRRRR